MMSGWVGGGWYPDHSVRRSVDRHVPRSTHHSPLITLLITPRHVTRQAKGIEIAKAFQRLTLDMDKPAKSKDYRGFLAEHEKGVQAFKDFFEVLNDVPDEL